MADPAQIVQKDDGKICDVGKREATIDDLYHVQEDGKAELVNGEIVVMPPTGYPHGHASLEIVVSLREYERQTRIGRAIPDMVAFVVNLPNRRSFCPDAAFHVGPHLGRKFIEGAPVFAAEVRSDEDDGPVAERRLAAKRADYFAAGTKVVWDVDVLREGFVRVYRASDPTTPTVYRKGDRADAEPAMPGWSMPVDDLFLPD
jgi:Uma2 family endonuclease